MYSLLQVVDGWETQGQFFPSDDDHPLPFEMRYRTYCGNNAPTVFVSSQNVALVQYRIPVKGQGFRVNIKLLNNEEREYMRAAAVVMVTTQCSSLDCYEICISVYRTL